MKMYEPGCSSSYTPLAASNMKVPLPAPVTMGHAIAFASIIALVIRAASMATAILASRSCIVRTCWADPW